MPQLLTPNAAALVAALGPAAARARVEPTTGTLLAAAIGHFQRHDYESMGRDVYAAAQLMSGVTQENRPAAEMVTAVLQVAHARFRNPARIGEAVGESTQELLLHLDVAGVRADQPLTNGVPPNPQRCCPVDVQRHGQVVLTVRQPAGHEFGAAAESIDNLPQGVFIHTCCFRGSRRKVRHPSIHSSDQPDGRRGAQFRDTPFRVIPVARPSGRTERVPRRLLLES